jgi:PhnB protein
MSKVRSIPEGFRTITPHLVVKDGAKAIEFYKKAFGAEEFRPRMSGPSGKVMHAELKIGDSMLMLADEFPEMKCFSPKTLKGTAVSIHLYVEDTDASFNRAVAAGATPLMPPSDMFWGERFCKLQDPFGHEWSIGTHMKDLTHDEVEQAGKRAMSEMMGKK